MGALDGAAAAAELGPPDAACPVVLYGPGVPLTADASASYVSKELFVSIAPSGTGAVDGEVRPACPVVRQ